MRSITTLDLQYAHRFYAFKGEAQYLHGHTGVLTIGVEDSVEPGGTQGIRGAGHPRRCTAEPDRPLPTVRHRTQ